MGGMGNGGGYLREPVSIVSPSFPLALVPGLLRVKPLVPSEVLLTWAYSTQEPPVLLTGMPQLSISACHAPCSTAEASR